MRRNLVSRKGLRRDLNPPQAVSVLIEYLIQSTAAYTDQAILRRPLQYLVKL